MTRYESYNWTKHFSKNKEMFLDIYNHLCLLIYKPHTNYKYIVFIKYHFPSCLYKLVQECNYHQCLVKFVIGNNIVDLVVSEVCLAINWPIKPKMCANMLEFN